MFVFSRLFGFVEMADLGEKAAKQLGEITECPICKSEVNDPRMCHAFIVSALNASNALQKQIRRNQET